MHTKGARAAIRYATGDRLPLIGPLVDSEHYQETYKTLFAGTIPKRLATGKVHTGLYANTGHGSRGLNTAFVGALVISSLINDQPLPISNSLWQALHPGRFLIVENSKKARANKHYMS